MKNEKTVPLFEINLADLVNFRRLVTTQITNNSAALLYLKNNTAKLPPQEEFLSDSEMASIAEFKSEERYQQHLISQYLIRTVLSSVLTRPSIELKLKKGPLGKPYVDESQNSLKIDFNISHTKDITLIGIAKEMQIGVDVEKIIEKKYSAAIATRFFQASEIEWMDSAATEEEKHRRFFRLWSMKEAVIKAVGGGVFQNIQQVSFYEKNNCLTLQSSIEPFNCSDCWTTFEFKDIADHACSVALFKA